MGGLSNRHNLFVRSTATGVVRQLSTAGMKDYDYASYYEWGEIMVGENGTRPQHFGVNWSPDSKWIQTYICDVRSAKKMYLLDWSVDTLYRARLLSYYRGSPGDTDMVYMTPVYFNVETGEEIRRDEFRNVNSLSPANGRKRVGSTISKSKSGGTSMSICIGMISTQKPSTKYIAKRARRTLMSIGPK